MMNPAWTVQGNADHTSDLAFKPSAMHFVPPRVVNGLFSLHFPFHVISEAVIPQYRRRKAMLLVDRSKTTPIPEQTQTIQVCLQRHQESCLP
jgi:hypothetical protein